MLLLLLLLLLLLRFVLRSASRPLPDRALLHRQVMAKVTHGTTHTDVPATYLAYWGGSLGGFLIGLMVKSSMMPEKAIQRPWADMWAQSHQLWHVILNGAFVLGTFLAWDVYPEWRRDTECPDSPTDGDYLQYGAG